MENRSGFQLYTFIKGLFLIIRPYNSFLAGFSIVIGVLVSMQNVEIFHLQGDIWLKILLGYLATFLIAAAGYVVNDVYDIEIDCLNQPNRPLPSGMLSVGQARLFALFLFFSGLLLSFMIDLFFGLVSLAASLSLFFYAKKYKKSGFIGNILVSLLTAFPFLIGGILMRASLVYYMIPAMFAFLLILGREIIKDIEDVPGDTLEDVHSLALMFNPRFARNVAAIILFILIFLSFLPLAFSIYQNVIWYLIMVLIVDFLILIAVVNLYRDVPTDEAIIVRSTLSKRLLKTSIFIGIFGFIFMPFVSIN